MPAHTRILVVDDFASMRKIVHNLLADLGYSDVVEAGSGADALQIAQSGTVDLIITDWNMPSMTGLELLQQIRANDRCRLVPVLMVTAQAHRDEILAAAHAGVSDYIIKPFTTSTLKRKIDGALGVSATSGPSDDAPSGDGHLDDPVVRARFLDEARELVANMAANMAAAAPTGTDATALLRGFHTLKGSAGFLGLDAIVHLCHAAEDLVDDAATPTQRQATRAALAAVDAALDAAAQDRTRPAADPAPTSANPEVAATGSAPEPVPVLLRIEARQIERLSGLTDSLGAACSRIQHASVAATGASDDPLTALMRAVEALAGAVHDLRVQPAGQLFKPLLQLAPSLAGRLGKQVRIDTHGDAVELERTVATSLTDPLMHLMRNALDHGIESPDQRQRAGKPAQGSIQIEASRADHHVHIQFSDDGAGIDAAAVRNRAVAHGLLAADAAASLSDADALALVFRPGLSMRDTITELSGRGMGLDIVRHAVEAAGGHVEVSSTAGHGSTFSLHVPVSLHPVDPAH
ncbi:MAG: response regulator [Rhodanobacteraceae bacterium]